MPGLIGRQESTRDECQVRSYGEKSSSGGKVMDVEMMLEGASPADMQESTYRWKNNNCGAFHGRSLSAPITCCLSILPSLSGVTGLLKNLLVVLVE